MKHANPFLGLWTALLMLVGLWAPPPAVADDGQYQILQARYGTSRANEDVTQRLKELARNDRSFRATNSLFGFDPAPGEVKVLRIYARARDGHVRTFEYPEKALVDGALFTGWGRGDWGSQGGYSGGWDGGGAVHGGGYGGGYGGGHGGGQGSGGGRDEDDGDYQILSARYGVAGRNVDVTDTLRSLARADRSFRASNERFGVDPAPGQVKVLRIYARARDGHTRSFEYGENATVDGALFTGWRSGNWGGGQGGGYAGGYGGGWGDDRHPSRDQDGYGSGRGRGQLVIVHAVYGADGRQRDITFRLRERVNNDRLDVRADNDLAGSDPAPNVPKTLWVTYTLDGGRELRARVQENDRLRLP